VDYPTTMSQAVDLLLSMLGDEQKERLRLTSPQDLWRYRYSLGQYISSEFGLWTNNNELLRSCYRARDECRNSPDSSYPDEPSEIIIHALWERLYVEGERRD